jgi:hypothetical protein
MDRYGGPQTGLTIAFHGCLYLAIIMVVMEGPNFQYYSHAWSPLLCHYNGPLWSALKYPYYSLAWRLIFSHYNGPLWRAPNFPYSSLQLRLIISHYNGTICRAPNCPYIAFHLCL